LAISVVVVLAYPATAGASGFQDIATQVGVAQSDQSFDTRVFDYNGDGLQDFLYSPQNDTAGRQLWRGNPDGTFTLVTHLRSSLTKDQHACTTADFDHNGLPDIYCVMGAMHSTRTKANPLWLQQADGSWKLNEASGAQDPYGRGYSTTALDANGDGWQDLFVDNDHPRADGMPTPNRLFLNRGTDVHGAWLGFADAGPNSGVEFEQGKRGCDFSTDFNGDGHADIVFCGTVMHFFQNNGDGTFTDVSTQKLGKNGFIATDAKLVDLNGDRLLDLVFMKNGTEGVRLGTTSGAFAPATLTHPMTYGRAVELADLNGDGILDIYALQGNGTPGCTDCPTNYPDAIYLGAISATGTYSSGVAGTFTTTATGSGDTVNAINIKGHNDVIVGNGANLTSGPLQLWAWTP